jgi:hypothetical protein
MTNHVEHIVDISKGVLTAKIYMDNHCGDYSAQYYFNNIWLDDLNDYSETLSGILIKATIKLKGA